MKDRIPGNTGRVRITPESGEAYYATLERADNPRQIGDALNKKNLLPDEVAVKLGLDPAANPVPADAFEHIATNGLLLNLTVHGGTSTPNDPKEGDIWVNTSIPVSGWAYAINEPSNPAEGKIWLVANANIALDTSAQGNITISPLSARQYIDGVWVSKEAKTYTNGEWKEWITLLINGSDECVDVTGGWESLATNIYDGLSAKALNVTTGDSYIELTGGGGGQGGIFVTKNKIRATGSTSLRISGEIAAYADRVKIAAMSSKSSDGVVAEWIVPGGSAGAEVKTYIDEAVLDLPAGEYYIAFSIYSTDFQYIKLNRVYLADKAGGAILPGGGTGGGEISAGAIAQAIESYFEANPIEGLTPTVMDYGAKGDGNTDDTAAFQTALAENRVVFVPGGTYKLSGELEIGHHCELELSADAVLNFTQTTGNCITLKYLSSLKGNHAVIEVPYAFTGNVINLNDYDVSADEYKKDVPPWRHYSPQHKSGRFITDINIGKVDGYGIHRSVDGWTGGTAVYLTTDDQYDSHAVWAAHFYNVRIAGAFSYGIRAVNFGAGWNHDMRIETTIEACEVGVSLENCHCAFVDAIIQPVPAVDSADNKTPYAKHGIKLVGCKAIDLSRSRVWDWNANCSLVTAGGEYQHIALYGDCTGLILSDYLYYWDIHNDIRDLIYTDTPKNLETVTILQEPFTRWFKPKENEPYFFNGNSDKRLALKEEIDEYFQTDRVLGYTDALAIAIDTDGTIYNGIGYTRTGGAILSDGTVSTAQSPWYGHTGYISCKKGDKLYLQGFDFTIVDGYNKAFLFDSSFNLIGQNSLEQIFDGTTTLYFKGTKTEDGGTLTVQEHTNAAYVRVGFLARALGENPVISVNDEIKYVQHGFLADGIKVKGENVVLTSPGGKGFLLSVSDDGTLSATATSV